jgi:hypothetical protein
MRRAFTILTDELDEVDAAERARMTKVFTSVLIRLLPVEDRVETMDFLNDQHQRVLS